MAKIVINISDDTYYRCKNERVGLLPFDVPEVCDAIRNGTPLPKGHSELVYREDVCDELRYMDNNGCITRSINHVIEDIKKGVPTIIEADKEGKA